MKVLVTATVLVAAVVAAPGTVAPGTAAAQGFCRWQPEVLPLPADASNGYVSAGAGDWYMGSIEEPGSPVRYRDGAWEALPKTGGSAWAHGINASGAVVGTEFDGTDDQVVVWPALGAPAHLPRPAGVEQLSEVGPSIDDDGTVVATYHRAGTGEGYVWQPGATTPTRLAPLNAGDSVRVTDISGGVGVGWNTDGQVVRTFSGLPQAVTRPARPRARPGRSSCRPCGERSEGWVLPEPAGYTDAGLNAVGVDTVAGGVSVGDVVVPVEWRKSC